MRATFSQTKKSTQVSIPARVISDKHIRAHFKYCQIKTHVKTAHECHDLKMDFRLFDNAFKQFCVTNFMQAIPNSLVFKHLPGDPANVNA